MPLLSNVLALIGIGCLVTAGFLASAPLGFAIAGVLSVAASRQVVA